ncbi:hypothetical protein M9H77_07747 [Catharanthus roseus]|uniref:Uncharacterized protein n=1 Tax=Catharanthus roseus TaxID=4058 RepID=A0ACC0BW26_CATRO|nr:hypothetical protein M9H77_07747 [Catharanthus roseus]
MRFSSKGYQYSTYNDAALIHQSPLRPILEDLLSKYIDSANVGVKRIEAVLRSQTASFQNMENHIKVIAKRIVQEPLSHIPSNKVTLWDVEEQVMTFPMFMDDDDEIAQELEEFTFLEEEEIQQEIIQKKARRSPIIRRTSSDYK